MSALLERTIGLLVATALIALGSFVIWAALVEMGLERYGWLSPILPAFALASCWTVLERLGSRAARY